MTSTNRIFIDTSVWIEYLRKNPVIMEELRDLITQDRIALSAPVRVELLSGSRKSELPSLGRILEAIPLFYPDQKTWETVEQWILQVIQQNHRFYFADLLIAAIASENHGVVWTLDSDFKRMENLKLVKLYKP